jgi:retinol dehydrogenase-12
MSALITLALFLIWQISYSFASSTNSVPKRPLQNILGSKKLALGAASIPALWFGKQFLDGPTYTGAAGSMTGKDVVITGGNTGLGKEAAIALASLGAHVTILCRSTERGNAAVEEIKSLSGSDMVSAEVCDLADLKSIDECSKRLLSRMAKVDVLMNNAGVMAIPQREVTSNGFEKHMGINHLGHFALTSNLMPLVEKSEAGRIVTVSSTAHLLGKLDRSNLLLESGYEPWPAYGNSKLANVLFTKALAAKLKEKGSRVVALVNHPGVCRTELGRYIFDPSKVTVPKFLYPVLGVIGSPAIYFTKSAKQGAQTQIFLAASPSISAEDSGRYFDNSREADTSPESKDMDEAEWLWQQSEALTGRQFKL